MRILTSSCWSAKKMASLDVFELPVNSRSSVSSTPARPRKRKLVARAVEEERGQVQASEGRILYFTEHWIGGAKPSRPCLFGELGDKAVQDATD